MNCRNDIMTPMGLMSDFLLCKGTTTVQPNAIKLETSRQNIISCAAKNVMMFTNSENSDKPTHPRRLIRVFPVLHQ